MTQSVFIVEYTLRTKCSQRTLVDGDSPYSFNDLFARVHALRIFFVPENWPRLPLQMAIVFSLLVSHQISQKNVDAARSESKPLFRDIFQGFVGLLGMFFQPLMSVQGLDKELGAVVECCLQSLPNHLEENTFLCLKCQDSGHFSKC